MAVGLNTISRWKDSLDDLQCPYTQDLSNAEVGHLLLNESEERLELLEWILLLHEPRLQDILRPASGKGRQIVKTKIERLLNAFHVLCLCHAEDVDLIKGVAPVGKQRIFINRLIDKAISKKSNQIISGKDMSTYIDALAGQGIFVGISEKIDLIPKDLKAECNSSYPGLDALKLMQQECSKEIDKLQGEITELQKRLSLPSVSSQKEVTAMNQMLSSSIQDFDQLTSGFLHSYESHIGAWCQETQPELNGLGPSAKRVHNQLRKFTPFLDDISKLRQLRCDLEDNVKEHQTRKSVEAVSTHNGTSDSIQRCLGVLEESIHRIDSGFKSRYPPLLQP